MSAEDEERRFEVLAAQTRASWETADYYDHEEDFEGQWHGVIGPFLEPHLPSYDFAEVLELAPGHGRCTSKLLAVAERLHLIDANETCIAACRKRFASHEPPPVIEYHVNDGYSLSMLGDESITFLFTWDAMVHFGRELVREYLREFARILRPNGFGFVHYSNYGALSPEARGRDWRENPHWRADMSCELFARYCDEVGLVVERGRSLDWAEVRDLDGLALVRKPAS